KIEAAAVACEAVELDQRQFDFLVSGIAALLSRRWAEGCTDMIDISLHGVEQPPPAGRAKVSDRPFEQMPRVIEFVVVAQVRPAVSRLAAIVPAVQIAV